MTVQRQEHLEGTIAAYDLLASLFLTLPDEDLVRSVQNGAFGEETGSEALDEIARYGQEQAERPVQDVLDDLSRDRVRLVRGVSVEGIQPPYESLYVGTQANEAIGSLNRFYAEQGYSLAEDVKDAPDQLGVEMAFAKLILEQELDALVKDELEKAAGFQALHHSFLSQHLGRWASVYGTAMAEAAATGFYRGVGLFIGELLPLHDVTA